MHSGLPVRQHESNQMAETRLIEKVKYYWQNILQSLLSLSIALQHALQTHAVSYVEGSLGKKIKPSGTFWDNADGRKRLPLPFFSCQNSEKVNLAPLVA